MKEPFVYPSIFAADFGRLADEAKRIADAGADGIHVDIMDGHFVPNLTLGPKALAAINRATPLFLDVHIMVYHPFDLVERLVEAGADRITFHFEATEQIESTISYIKKCGIQAGMALCPETSVDFAFRFLPLLDLLLLMTVSPGFGGQKFEEPVLEKIEQTYELLKKQGLVRNQEKKQGCFIEVDGGINEVTAKKCIEKGANALVSGTYLFSGDMEKKIIQLKRGINGAK